MARFAVQGARPAIIIYLFVALSLVWFFAKVVLLSAGNVLNNYPYISPDGFDWLAQGFYLSLRLKGVVAEQVLPVLRPPIFVLVTMVDALAGQTGAVIAAVLAAAWGATIVWVVRLVGPAEELNRRPAIAAFVVGLLLVAPINCFRAFILSDGLCIALALASYYFYHRYVWDRRTAVIAAATVLAVLAGSTQTYGLGAPLAAAFVVVVALVKSRQFSAATSVIFSVAMIISAFAVIRILWSGAIAQIDTPQTFGLIRFSFEMASFYLHTWAFYFLAVLPVFAAALVGAARLWSVFRSDLVFLSAAGTTAAFGILCFFYEAMEARFSLFFWPWLVIVVGKLLLALRTVGFSLRANFVLMLVCGLLLLLQSFVVRPENYWMTAWSRLVVKPRETWALQFIRNRNSADRLGLERACGSKSHVCANAKLSGQHDNYSEQSLRLYVRFSLEARH